MNRTIKIGLELKDNYLYAARVENQTGRDEVKALLRFERDKFSNHALLENGQVIFAVDDNHILLKQLNLENENYPKDEMAKFELLRLFNEPEENFIFDLVPTGLDNEYLGLTLRKEHLNQTLWPLLKEKLKPEQIGSCRMRSAALAMGYIKFCRSNGGDLSAIVDIGETQTALAVLYKNQIVDLSRFGFNQLNLNNDDSFNSFSVELKTAVNYRLSNLFDKGISLPLSNLIVTGENLTDSHLEKLKKYFNLPISRPQINPGFFPNQQNTANIPLDKYLIALGLTVE